MESEECGITNIDSLMNEVLTNRYACGEQMLLRHHLNILAEIGAIRSSSANNGFSVSGDNVLISATATFELTYVGHSILAAMRNESVMTKIAAGMKFMGIKILEQAPAIAASMFIKS
jgi:hypothetical protein